VYYNTRNLLENLKGNLCEISIFIKEFEESTQKSMKFQDMILVRLGMLFRWKEFCSELYVSRSSFLFVTRKTELLS
jgi:hypothetical protein